MDSLMQCISVQYILHPNVLPFLFLIHIYSLISASLYLPM
uniref:Uncharacterized protein n=1 Tax=Anguilla anguilla TaxID=7936 RepID=A0A0E9S5G6_ANGAN